MLLQVTEVIVIIILFLWLHDINEEKNKDIEEVYHRISELYNDIKIYKDEDNNITTTIPVVKTSNNAKLPHRGSDEAAGYDLHALLNENKMAIPPHTTVKIDTGLKMSLPKGYTGLIYARSGLATKQGLAPANKVGVVDSDYRGEIIVALHNHTDKEQFINDGDRIAQLVIAPYKKCEFIEVADLDKTKRGDGGFGHSGK